MSSDNAYKTGQEFIELFGRIEYALKRGGHLVPGKKRAEANWRSFARELGPNFFEEVVRRGIADTLINDPPRQLMSEGLSWERRTPAVLRNVDELFAEGVCRVRNSLFHGEKFVGGPAQWERDSKLVAESLEVLKLTLSQGQS